jgi:hypothetical protein
VPISADLLAAGDQNLIAAWRGITSLGPRPGEVRDGDALMFSTGLPVPLFNPAFVATATADPASLVARVGEHYRALELPFVLMFRDEVTEGLADACASAGLVEHWRPPLMVLTPVPRVPPAPAPLRIEVVTTARLGAYAEVLASGFGMPWEIASVMAHPGLLDLPELVTLIGMVEDEPVGASAACIAGGVAGVYNVATVPDSRRAGIGAAMTWAAVAAGRGAAADCVILQSSEQGAPVYARMGFSAPTSYRQFQPAG